MVAAGLIDALVVFSLDDEVVWVNQATEHLLGLPRRALIGRNAKQALAMAPWTAELVARFRESPEKNLRGSGTLGVEAGSRQVVAVVSQLLDRTGSPHGVIVSLEDHSPRSRIQNDDERRVQRDALNRLVASVAHELNNPLAGIRGAAQAIGGKADPDGQLRDYAEMIVRQSDRMSDLIASLLLLEAPPAELTPTNIHRILNEVLFLEESVAAAKGVTLGHEFDPSLPNVLGDGARLQQLFLNLLKNAIEASPGNNGQVWVRTRIENSFYIHRDDKRVRYIAVEVTDNGPGLDGETLTELFTPFFSRTEGGHGLGLSIAHSIVDAHGGRIRAENHDGGGACFSVLLPVAEEAAV